MDMVGEVMDMVGPMIRVILDRKDSFSLLHSYYSRGHFKTFTYYIKLEQITQQDILYSLGQTRPSWREADAVTMFFLITTFHTQFPLFQKWNEKLWFSINIVTAAFLHRCLIWPNNCHHMKVGNSISDQHFVSKNLQIRNFCRKNSQTHALQKLWGFFALPERLKKGHIVSCCKWEIVDNQSGAVLCSVSIAYSNSNKGTEFAHYTNLKGEPGVNIVHPNIPYCRIRISPILFPERDQSNYFVVFCSIILPPNRMFLAALVFTQSA